MYRVAVPCVLSPLAALRRRLCDIQVALDQYGIAFAEDRLQGWVVGREGVILQTSDGGAGWKEEDSGVKASLNAVHHGNRTGRTWIAGNEGVILTRDKGGTGWIRRDSGVESNLNAIHAAADDMHVWAVGADGTIVHSGDGGNKWAKQASGTEDDLHAVHAGPKTRHAWVAGDQGRILHTTDHGRNWHAKPIGLALRLDSIHLSADSGRGLAVGEYGFVFTSEDGGETWTWHYSGVHADLTAVRLLAGGARGWALGHGGVAIVTEDGGDTWTPRDSRTHRSLNALHFSADGRHGWVAGRDGFLLSTADGGKTWTVLRRALPRPPDFNAVQLSVDGHRGWLAGDHGAIIASSDGGATWAVQDSGTCVDLLGLHMSGDDAHGWAVGDHGTILATGDGGRTWQQRSTGGTDDLHAVSMTPDGRRGWAVGDCGTMFETKDGGDNWKKVKSDTDTTLYGIHAGARGNRSWAVGDGGTMLASDVRGNGWARRPSVTDRILRSVHFTDDGRHGWVAGGEGTIVATTDGGATWNQQPTTTRKGLWSILFAGDGQRGWAVGDAGTIIATKDGGGNWFRRTTQTGENLYHVHFSADGRHGWAVGARGTVLTTSDGGTRWISGAVGPDDTPVRHTLVGVHFADDNRFGWAVGDRGHVYISRDGGNRWSERKDVDIKVEGVHVADGGRRIWAAGLYGEISTADFGWQEPTKRLERKRSYLTAVHGAADKLRGWAVGSLGTILATDDGGVTWTPQQSESDSTMYAVRAIADGGRWAAGEDGRILTSGKGEVRWTPQTSKTDRDIHALDFDSAGGQRGWAAGLRGTILSTDDGGEAWIVRHDYTDEALRAIGMADDGLHGWAVGHEGTVLATGDGWRTLARQDVGADFDFKAIDVAGSGDAVKGWIAGGTDRILVAGKSNGTPYLTSFDATRRPDGNVELRFAATDDEDDGIEVAGIEMCDRQKPEPHCEDLTLEKLKEDGNRWTLDWDPATTGKVPVGSGSLLQFNVTLRERGGAFSFKHATETYLEYGGWFERMWDRYREEMFMVLAVFGLFLLYMLALLGLFLFNPVILVRISSALAADASAGSLAQTRLRPVFLALHAIVLRRLVSHPRTMRAWILHYTAQKAKIADLAPAIRSRYLNEPDVLDAWVATRADDAEDAILSRLAATEQSVFVDLPVTLEEGEEPEAVPTQVIKKVQTVLGRPRGVVAICGAGGGGKTTFAAELAKWAWSDDKEDWAFGPRAIPVWIDFDTTDLPTAVTEELRKMIGREETEPDIVKALLAGKRVLVIVDGLTERKRATRLHVWHIPGNEEFDFNALVVTGREAPNMERVPIVRLSLIDDRTIHSFIRAYAATAHRDVKLGKQTRDAVAGRVLAIVGQRGRKVPMTPLLVCLFVKSAAEQIQRDGECDPDSFVKSVPETIIDYLKSVNPQDEDASDRLENAFMLMVVKALGRAALEPDFVPKDLESGEIGRAIERARSKYLDGSGSAGVDAETIVRRLVANDVVEWRSVAGNEWLRFKFDPVAEYMAALDLLEDCGSSDADWAALLEKLEREDFAGAGFLSCLFDVVSTYGDTFAVPEGARQKLDALAAASTQAKEP